jgi:hypothetical protein
MQCLASCNAPSSQFGLGALDGCKACAMHLACSIPIYSQAAGWITLC